MKKIEYFNENIERLEILNEFIENNELGLIPVLKKTQEIFGNLDEYNLAYISEQLKIPVSKIYGVASYYSEFKFEKPSELVIEVCTGTACFLKGSDAILEKIESLLNLKAGEKSEDGRIELKTTSCLGFCNEAPVISINNKIYGNMNTEKIEEVLNKYL